VKKVISVKAQLEILAKKKKKKKKLVKGEAKNPERSTQTGV